MFINYSLYFPFSNPDLSVLETFRVARDSMSWSSFYYRLFIWALSRLFVQAKPRLKPIQWSYEPFEAFYKHVKSESIPLRVAQNCGIAHSTIFLILHSCLFLIIVTLSYFNIPLQEERRAQLPKYAPAILPMPTVPSPMAQSASPAMQQPHNIVASSPMLLQVRTYAWNKYCRMKIKARANGRESTVNRALGEHLSRLKASAFFPFQKN